MHEYDELDSFFDEASSTLGKSEEASKFARYFYAACFKGNTTFYQKNLTETQIFDDEWIKTIESFIPSIDAIVRNPRLAIKYEEEVVAIEKAKKTGSASVRHLSSHTQLIKQVKRDEYGHEEIQPKKILSTYSEEMYATYENRFIMTLIEKLFLFIRRRYEVIQQNKKSFQKDHMAYESHFELDNQKVDASIDISVERDLDDAALSAKNNEMVERINKIMEYAISFRNSAFMKKMAEEKAKKVLPPIMKTNVILKNVDFHNCYMLWLFLDRYYKLGFDVEVRERNIKLADGVEANLHRLCLMTYTLAMHNLNHRSNRFENLPDLKPTLKKSTKIALNNPADFVANPHAIQMEQGLINEYYLGENKKVFNNKFKELVESEMSEAKALRKAIADTLEISDALYQTIFYLKDDTDYFDLMAAQRDDPQKDYDDCMFKIKLAKVIREEKEASYKKSIKLERELVKKMTKASEALVRYKLKLKAQEAKIRQQQKIEKEIEAFKEQKKENKKQIAFLEGRQIDTATNKSTLQLEFEEMKRVVDEQTARIKAEERAKLEAELQAIMKKHEEKMGKLRAMEIAKLRIAKEHQQARLAAEKERVKTQIKAFKDAEIARNKAIIAKAKADNAAKEEQTKANIDKKVEKIETQTEHKIATLEEELIIAKENAKMQDE